MLATHRESPAIFRPDGAPLRTFAGIEQERQALRDALGHLARRSVVIGRLGNAPAWPALFLACLDLELVLLPVEDGVPPEQLSRIATLTQAQALVSSAEAIEHF